MIARLPMGGGILFVPGCLAVFRSNLFCKQNNLSNPKPRHTTGSLGRIQPVESKTRTCHWRVGSKRPAERPGGFGQDWVQTELFAQETKVNCSPLAIGKCRFNIFLKARTSEMLGIQTEEQNQQLTTGLSAVYYRDEKRALFLAAET